MSYTIETYPDRESWLKARKNGLGASDAATVLGMGRFRRAYSVAVDKLTEAVDTEMDEMQEAGLRHEPTIAKWFAEKMGWETVIYRFAT
jgi:predicted phage-related endonuclease